MYKSSYAQADFGDHVLWLEQDCNKCAVLNYDDGMKRQYDYTQFPWISALYKASCNIKLWPTVDNNVRKLGDFFA